MTNKCIIKALLMFSVGAGSGVLATKGFFDRKYSKLAIDEMEAYRQKILGQLDGGEIVDDTEPLEDVVVTEIDDLRKEASIVATPYHKAFKAEMKDVSNKKPYQIGLEEYTSEYNNYEKEDLNFYGEDCTLTDDQAKVIPNAIDLVGDVMDKYESWSKLFIRNEVMKKDFEVTYLDISYREAVLGYDE